MHAGQGVERHAEALQQLGGGDHRVEGGFAALAHPEPVVQVARAVDAESHQETVFLEKPRPVLVQQHPVGLQVVLDPLAGLGVLFLERHHLAEEVQPAQHRFPALPGKHHLRAGDALDVLLDEPLQGLIVHAPAAGTLGQVLLAQIETVGAIQVAGGAGGLGHGVEPPGGPRPQFLGHVVFVGGHLFQRTQSVGRVRAGMPVTRRWMVGLRHANPTYDLPLARPAVRARIDEQAVLSPVVKGAFRNDGFFMCGFPHDGSLNGYQPHGPHIFQSMAFICAADASSVAIWRSKASFWYCW